MSRALLIVLFLLLNGPASALADPCEDNPVIGSTDGDSVADVAAAAPAAGAVVVRQSDPPGTLTLAGDPGFGTAMALADVHGDGCADLLVGTPGGARVDVYDGAPE